MGYIRLSLEQTLKARIRSQQVVMLHQNQITHLFLQQLGQ